jgi:hypothetical protein
MTATGATTSYEIRLAIADRLGTNEAFLRWATAAVSTAVCKLAQGKSAPIYGAAGLTSSNLQITASANVGGLYAEATYERDTNSDGPICFIIEGGTNPIIGSLRNPYRMEAYQLDPKAAESPFYPRKIARMDWGNAAAPLDQARVEAMAREAYIAMTGTLIPDGDQAIIRVPAVTDWTFQDPAVQVTGKPGATVRTINNERYPFAEFEFFDPATNDRIFRGQMVQTSPGRGEIVELFTTPSTECFQNSLIDLAQQFLPGDWAQEVQAKFGSTPPDQVLKRVWRIPDR